MELRAYQQDLVDDIKQELRKGKRSVCAVLGCGGGKSVIQGTIAKMTTQKNNRVLFLVHRKELCQQITDTFGKCGVDFGLCDVKMVQTVARRICKGNVPEPQLIITDECHHALSNSYKRIYEKFPKAIRLGFTATPCRLNDGGLGAVFDSMVEGVSTKWLIENNYLSPYEYYGAKLVNTDKLRTKAGEFLANDVAELMESNYVYGEVLKTWHKLAEGKKTIIYCASIKASKDTINQFIADGVAAAHLDGETAPSVRAKTIQDFRDGKITVLSNVDLFGEGFDVPDCECVVLLRPTKSLTLHIQQSMRSMRYKEGKTAIIIDHVGNVYRHGLPDEVREWTLETKKKKNEEIVVKIKECKVCFKILPASTTVCPECGYEFPHEIRDTEAETVSTELVKLSSEDVELAMAKYSDYKKIDNWDDMERFRKAKKYKFMWSIRKCLELGIEIPGKYDFMVRKFAR